MNTDLNSNSVEETFRLGESLGKTLKGKELIFLSGDLGAGKTVFTKGIGHHLGIRENDIVSPSYSLMNIYRGRHTLFHIDLYRIGESIKGGIPEIDDNLDRGIIVVEWAEFIREHYHSENNLIEISIHFRNDRDSGRTISVRTDIALPPLIPV